MNFYKHHLGDYDSATMHLSWLEDMAYTRLLRIYYRTEQPIHPDIKQVFRLVRATSKSERDAVQSVLEEFFTLKQDGWHQDRCDQEIGIASDKAERNRTVGKLGGRPRKTETQTVLETEPTENPNGFFYEPTENPSQTPDSRLQTKTIPIASASTTSTGVDAANGNSAPASPGEISKAMRQASIDSNPSDPRIMALAEQGVTVSTVSAACDEARKAKPGERIPPAYVIRIIERWASDAKGINASGANKPGALTAQDYADIAEGRY